MIGTSAAGTRESRRRRLAPPWVLAALLAAGFPAWVFADDHSEKADMICSVAKFVQWPEAVMTLNKGQIVVSILGEDDLAADMASVLSSRSVNGRPIFVRFARRVQDVRGAQIVYVAGSELPHADEILASLKGTPTLTMAENEGFVQRGGMIDFSGTSPHLRIEVGLARARSSGLTISSRLLALARVVDASP